jgi:hypothetical protein
MGQGRQRGMMGLPTGRRRHRLFVEEGLWLRLRLQLVLLVVESWRAHERRS